MFQKFIKLEWARFFRSAYWQRSLALNILLGLGALYLLLLFFSFGVGLYFILKKHFPDKEPLTLVNNYLFYWLTGDLIMRYMAQSLPQASVKSLLILPVKKRQISRYILFKSTISFWVWLPLMFFIPFVAVLWYKGISHFYLICWLSTITGLILTNNYLNYLINKNQKILGVLVIILLFSGVAQYFNLIDLPHYFGMFMNGLKVNPWITAIPFLTAGITAYVVYRNIYNQLYFDEGIFDNQNQKVNTTDWQFTNRFGETGLYLNNELKLILRNKRTKQFKTLFLLPLMGLFYIFGDMPDDKLVSKFMFPAFYVLGTVTFSYGIYIPSWDSTYYPLLMTQKVNFYKYLKSKWLFLSMINLLLFVLSIPYGLKNIKLFWLLMAVFFLNIGFANLVVLWNGAYNTKRIDLDRKATFNTQGVSGRSLLISMLVVLVPMIMTVIAIETWGFYPGIAMISVFGLLGFLLKNKILYHLSRLYLRRKYKTLHGFKQE